MKFRYFKFLLEERSDFFGTSILKPIIPIEISVGTLSVGYAALIDSGADMCIFDAGIGESLGLTITSGISVEFGGIQERGGAKAYLHDVTLTIGGYKIDTRVGFSYEIAKHGYAILGQKGFFDIFVVKFDLKKEVVELKQR